MITSGIECILISVKDMEESLAFYRTWVGMKVVADQNLNPEKIQKLWNLSKGTKARAVFLKNEEQSTLLELIEFQPHSGRVIRAGAKSWDYGISFETDNLSGLMEKFKKENVSILSGPVEMDSGPSGKIKAITAEGPSRIIVEFFQIL